MLDLITKVARRMASGERVGLILIAFCSLCVIASPRSSLASVVWLIGVVAATLSKDLRMSEKIALVLVGFVPLDSTLASPPEHHRTVRYHIDDTGHVVHAKTDHAYTMSWTDHLPLSIMLVPALVAVLIGARLARRRYAPSRPAGLSNLDDRSQVQSVEIVFAISLGAEVGLLVFAGASLLRHLAGAADRPDWLAASATLAAGAAAAVWLRQTLRTLHGGL